MCPSNIYIFLRPAHILFYYTCTCKALPAGGRGVLDWRKRDVSSVPASYFNGQWTLTTEAEILDVILNMYICHCLADRVSAIFGIRRIGYCQHQQEEMSPSKAHVEKLGEWTKFVGDYRLEAAEGTQCLKKFRIWDDGAQGIQVWNIEVWCFPISIKGQWPYRPAVIWATKRWSCCAMISESHDGSYEGFLASKQPPMTLEVIFNLGIELSDLNYPASMLFLPLNVFISRSFYEWLSSLDLRGRTSPQVKMWFALHPDLVLGLGLKEQGC